MEDVAWLGRVGRGLQPLEGIPGAAVTAADARDDVKLATAGVGLGFGVGGGGDGARFVAAVGISQGQAEFVGLPRFEKESAGRPVVQAQRAVLNADGGVGTHGRGTGVPIALPLPAKLEAHRAVQVVVAVDPPHHTNVLKGGIGANLAGDDLVARGGAG